jgi:uncharacterized protein (DUF1800 family)
VPRFFRPFVPDDRCSFDQRAAAHLLRRTGFGAPPAVVEKAVAEGLEATVDGLFEPASDEEADYQRTFAALQSGLVDLSDIGYVQGWWVWRMLSTRVPLVEKLTLFWHGHFATSIHKVEDAYLVHRQIETLRRLGFGSFRDLVLSVARDPAMLVYLDGESSDQEHPNENFARELMELFTCGIGNYTEKDVLEAARAFTGWHREVAEFVFNADAHDGGRKEFLAHAGRFNGTDIVDLLMQQPATPRRIAERLLRFFATPEPTAEVVDEAARVLDRTQMNIKWFLRELFLSDYFYSKACLRKRLSSPAEYTVGTARTLGVRVSGIELKDHMSAMGQELFAPPNVKGWDGERTWINSRTWPKRLEFARFVSAVSSETPFGSNLDISALVPDDMNAPQQVIDRLDEILLQGDLPDDAKPKLLELVIKTDDGPNRQLFHDDAGFRHDRIRAALAVMLSLPEYHTY